MTTVTLEVSVGEALDKLSILDIKCKKIKDINRLKFCIAERELLLNTLDSHVGKFRWHYDTLVWINESIWNIQDEVRIEDGFQHIRLKKYAMRIQDENDMRFRIKDKINKLTISNLREQKGYPARRAFFLGHLGLGDLINHIGAIRYFSTMYDEVTVVIKRSNEKNARSFFRDDPSITFYLVDSDSDISPQLGGHAAFSKISKEYTKCILSGAHMEQSHPWDDISDCFYKDMQIPLEVRHIFHYIPIGDSRLYEGIKDIPYIFVHQTTSTGKFPIVTWDINSTLTIDPNANLYSVDHMWHSLAELCVGKPLVDYIEVIRNAIEIHVLDSSFSCLAQYVLLHAKVAKCYRRRNGTHIPAFSFKYFE